MNILIFVIILLVLVLVHEFGHFFTAKKFGIRVDEFGFGFPPKIFGIKKGETEYTLNLLPIGGFVKIFGESPDDLPAVATSQTLQAGENTVNSDEDRKFYNKPKWQQAIVLVAGVVANFLLAWVLFSIGFMSGLPTSVGTSEDRGYELENVGLTVISVASDSPASLGGLQSGDKIVSIADSVEEVSSINPETLKSFIISHGDQEINIGYTRGQIENINYANIIPTNTSGDKPSIGISMDEIGVAKLSIFRAFGEGMRLTLSVTRDTALGLYMLISEGIRGKGSFDSVTGPVGMVGIVGDAYQFGIVYLLSFAALISINLAIINLLPFPALDGGRLFFLLIEKIKGSRINPRVTNTINTIGFSILILLMVLVTFHDVVQLF